MIFVDGPINSGKTTVSKLLAQRLPKTVHVEIDDLRHFADCLLLDEAIPFALQDAISVSENWVRRGFNVVVSWPLSPENHRILQEAMLRTEAIFFAFTLLPRQEVCLSNRGTRELKPSEIDRVKKMVRRCSERNPVGEVIDNSEQTPDKTVDEILRRLAEAGLLEKHQELSPDPALLCCELHLRGNCPPPYSL